MTCENKQPLTLYSVMSVKEIASSERKKTTTNKCKTYKEKKLCLKKYTLQ